MTKPGSAKSGRIFSGWWTSAEILPSPNCNVRPDISIDLLVIHNISLPPGSFGGRWVEAFFLNRLPSDEHPWFQNIADLKVSAHCYIDREGRVLQFVPFHLRAWHAGESIFQGRSNCNDYSIGIELEGTDSAEFTLKQYQSLAVLSSAIMAVYPKIIQDRIVGHSDIAPGRKTDPGEAFNWDRFRAMLSKHE